MTDHLHEDELHIDAALVRQLVDHAFPDFSALPIRKLGATGSTNLQFRLGDELLVRLPRQAGGGAGIVKERRWTATIGRHLPVSVPEFVAIGEPGFGYPECWSIMRWQAGEHPKVYCPEASSPGGGRRLAAALAETVAALRDLEVSADLLGEAQLQNYRGRSLAAHDEHLRRNIDRCKSIPDLDLDLDAALAIWQQTLALPEVDDGPQWYHGDLVAENLLINSGQLTGVLDFGGLGVGDPSVDLHGAWELFDPPARDEFRKRLGVDDAQWQRGRAWALAIALMTFPYYWRTMPGRIADRLAMARAVLADAG